MRTSPRRSRSPGSTRSSRSPTRARPQWPRWTATRRPPELFIALATCAQFAALEADDVLLARALGDATPAVWDDPAVDWAAFDLVVIRSTWDYTGRRDQFVEWAQRVGDRLVNPPEVVRWNTDKRY